MGVRRPTRFRSDDYLVAIALVRRARARKAKQSSALTAADNPMAIALRISAGSSNLWLGPEPLTLGVVAGGLFPRLMAVPESLGAPGRSNGLTQ